MISKIITRLFPRPFELGLRRGISCARWCHSRIEPGYPMSSARADVIREIISYVANNKGNFPDDYYTRFEALNEKPGWWPK